MGGFQDGSGDGGVLGTKVLDILQHVQHGKLSATVVVVLIALAIAALMKLLTPAMDPCEPPLVKPTIPIIGHIIGIVQHQSSYHKILRSVHRRFPDRSVCLLISR